MVKPPREKVVQGEEWLLGLWTEVEPVFKRSVGAFTGFLAEARFAVGSSPVFIRSWALASGNEQRSKPLIDLAALLIYEVTGGRKRQPSSSGVLWEGNAHQPFADKVSPDKSHNHRIYTSNVVLCPTRSSVSQRQDDC